MAVVDFGCCSVGDPACDGGVAWTFEADSRSVFMDRMAFDEGTWAELVDGCCGKRSLSWLRTERLRDTRHKPFTGSVGPTAPSGCFIAGALDLRYRPPSQGSRYPYRSARPNVIPGEGSAAATPAIRRPGGWMVESRASWCTWTVAASRDP